MGGKTKQSQRTKNNVRPSSSGRSAELLSGTGGAPALFPSLQPSPAAARLDNVDPEFAMCFKKLNKKDPITRTKALQELTSLVANGSAAQASALVASWARVYGALSGDGARSVREAAQRCHGAVAARVGRGLAPALRQLLPPWLAATHDPAPQAAAAAQHSLASTFPEGKLPEVISFCKAEVLSYVMENITGNADILKNNTSEEAVESAERAVAGALRALQQLVVLLPLAHDDWLWDGVTPLIHQPAFWSLPQRAALRAAWCGAVGGAAARGRRWGAAWGAAAAPALLTVARAAPALALPTLLLLLQRDPDWPVWMGNKKKEFCDRLFEVIEKGGWGDARALAALLRSLLPLLPPDWRAPPFHQRLFAALHKGSEKKAVSSSKSEREHWMSCVTESVLVAGRDQPGVGTAELGRWLATVTVQPDWPRPLAHRLAPLLRSGFDGNPRTLWHCLGVTLQAQAESPPDDDDTLTRAVEAHATLLLALKAAARGDVRRQRSIKFSTDVDNGDRMKTEELPTTEYRQNTGDLPATDASAGDLPKAEASLADPLKAEASLADPPKAEAAAVGDVEEYLSNALNITAGVCAAWLRVAEEGGRECVLPPLLPLLRAWAGGALWARLAASPAHLLRDWLRWLARPALAPPHCEALIELVLLLTSQLPRDEQERVFASFDQLPAPALSLCVCVALSPPHRGGGGVRGWVTRPSPAPPAAALAAAVARRLAGGGGDIDKRLLDAALACDDQGELPFSAETMSAVVAQCCDALIAAAELEPTPPATSESAVETSATLLESALRVAARVALALAAAPALAAPLAPALFELLLRVPRDSGRVSLGSWLAARAACQDVLDTMTSQQRVTTQSAAFRALQHQSHELNLPLVEHIASLCPDLLSGWAHPGPTDDDLAALMQLLALHGEEREEGEGAEGVEAHALRADVVEGRLQVLFADSNRPAELVLSDPTPWPALRKTTLVQYAHGLVFRAALLRALTERDGEMPAAVWERDGMLQLLQRLYYDHAVLEALHEGYEFSQHHELAGTALERVSQLITPSDLAPHTATRRHLRARLCAAAATLGHYWPRAARYFTEHCALQDDDVAALPLPQPSGCGYYHCLQEEARCAPALALRTRWALAVRALHTTRPALSLLPAAADLELDLILDAYYKHNDILLYDRDVSTAPWTEVFASVSVAALLAAWLQPQPATAPTDAATTPTDAATTPIDVATVATNVATVATDVATAPTVAASIAIEDRHWDFAALAACSLLNSVRLSFAAWTTAKVSALCVSVCALVRALSAAAVAGAGGARAQEWRDVFEPELARLYDDVLTAALESGDGGGEMCSARAACLTALRQSSTALRPAAAAGEEGLRRHVTRCCSVLSPSAAHRHVLLLRAAHAALRARERPLVLLDVDRLAASGAADEASGGSTEEAPPLPVCLDYYVAPLMAVYERLDAALQDVVCDVSMVGEDAVSPAPHSSLHSLSLSFLLLADALLQTAALAKGDLVHHYILHCRTHQYCAAIVSVCLRLVPGELARREATPRQYQSLFDDPPMSRPPAQWPQALACAALAAAARGPSAAAVRSWWGAASPRASRLLERVLAAYVTPGLVRDQMTSLQRHKHTLTDTEIVLHWSTYEVECWVEADDRRVLLQLQLGRAHPLQLPTVTSHAPVSTHWLKLYLSYQNGGLLDALRLWCAAVSRRVAAAPVCYICYCRLQPGGGGGGGGLPRVTCHVCSHRFHHPCLRKWFATSKRSTCPLCRAAF